MQTRPHAIRTKLDVRMQISLSREDVEAAKKAKPVSMSLSAYVREALEEKTRKDKKKSKDWEEVLKAFSKPMKKKAPSIKSLLKWEREIREDRPIKPYGK